VQRIVGAVDRVLNPRVRPTDPLRVGEAELTPTPEVVTEVPAREDGRIVVVEALSAGNIETRVGALRTQADLQPQPPQGPENGQVGRVEGFVLGKTPIEEAGRVGGVL